MSGEDPATPWLTLLGRPGFRAREGERIAFTTERPFQLLAYLGCSRRWVRRDELADILYPERDAQHARSNLRKVLLLADRLAGQAIEREGDLLRWQPDSDLAAFEAALEERRLADAVALGAVPLLEGFDAAFLGDGRAWLAGERQRIATLWQSVCMQRVAELADSPAEAAKVARLLLGRDPLDEAGVLALARAHIALGEGDAAQVTIASYSKRLADELGLEPTAAIREAADAARQASAPAAAAQMPSAASAPVAFIGRRVELNRMLDLLRRPDCRLLVVTGPGGVGKTSIVRQLAGSLAPAIVESVVMVPLADLTEAEQMPARIAERIGVTLSGDAGHWAQIGAAIGERSLALVFDNAEQLDAAAPLEGLLAAAPRLKMIVTSRARLSLAAETAFALDGLPLPDEDETDVEVLRCCDAVALFEMRALAASGGFDLAAHARGAVRLVHAVEGLPLAIELAAVWTRLLPAAEIADEVAGSVDLLEDGQGSSRGLRASFTQSWRLLSDAERACLPRLARLPGDFDRDMARQVASAPLPVLAALVDKSLLRADGSGRFSMHPLLRSCAAERAAPGDDILPELAAFVARWMGEWDGTALHMQVLLDRITAEQAHVRAAWSWALARGDASVIGRMGRPVSNFFEQQGLWAEGMASLNAAVKALRRADAPDEHALGVVFRGLAALQYRRGAADEVEVSAREMIALARSLGNVRLMRYAINMSGVSLQQRGRYEEARSRFAEGLERSVAEGSAPHTALFTANIANSDAFLGRYEDALAGHERALALYREQVNDYTAAIELVSIGTLHRVLGRPEAAVERLNEALVACAQHGFKSVQCTVSLNLGLAFDERGQPEPSARWLATALRESRQHGEPHVEIQALLASIRLDCGRGDAAAARATAWEALTLADRAKAPAMQALCAAAFGEIFMHEGRLADGVALVHWAGSQPSIDRMSRDLLERRLAVLGEHRGGAAVEPRELSPGTPLAAVLAIAATPGS